MKKLWMMPLLILILAACQANTAEEAEKNETNEVNENEESQNENNAETEAIVDLSLYDDVLKEYEALTEMSMEEAENTSFDYVKSGGLFYFYEDGIHEGISAAYYDLNGDGVDELIITLGTQGSHSLIDLYSIVDGELVSIFTDDMSAAAMMKRSGYSLTKNGNLIYMTASGQGDRFGTIYELKEEPMKYEVRYEVSLDEGDFSVIEEELENNLDLHTLDWQAVDKKQENTAYEDFAKEDYSALEGKWGLKNNDEFPIEIVGNKVTFVDGDYANMYFRPEFSDGASNQFNLIDEDGFGSLLYFYPAENELEFDGEYYPSDVKKDRIFITQSDPPQGDVVYYKLND